MVWTYFNKAVEAEANTVNAVFFELVFKRYRIKKIKSDLLKYCEG